MKLSKNGTWKHSKLSDKDYDTYHNKGTKAKYHENSEKKLLVDSYDNFVLMAEIDGECESTLKVKLFEDLDRYNKPYLSKLAELEKCGTVFKLLEESNCTQILTKG